MFVVKANAYGHGLKEIAEITRKLSFIDYYAVDSLQEALLLKNLEIRKPILVMGWSDHQELQELIKNGFETVAPSLDHLKQINRIAQCRGGLYPIHIKIETGTRRLGMEPEKAIALLNDFPFKQLYVKGIYSHFANIEDTTESHYARCQLQLFQSVLRKLKKPIPVKHFSCSASALLFPETYFDMVRVGISAYGYWPSKQTYVSYLAKKSTGIQLKRVLNWYGKMGQVKNVSKGASIGYGLTYKTLRPAKIGVVPVGYYDGYDRKLSNQSYLIIRGQSAPIRGRICMNMMMAEITHINGIRTGDRVALIGEENGSKIDADKLAELAGTINYEILARINPLLPRVVI